jgi:hypothetical protein
MKPIFDATVKDGKIKFNRPDLFNLYLGAFEDKEVIVTVESKRYKRSLKQNNYYWGVVIPIIGDYLGYDPDEMHEALKWKFLRKTNSKDPKLMTVKSTTSLSTVEFIDYVDRIVRWAAIDYQISIPDPDQIMAGETVVTG